MSDEQTRPCDDCGEPVREFDAPFGTGTIGPNLCDDCKEARDREIERRQREARKEQVKGRLRKTGMPDRWILEQTDPPDFLREFVRADYPSTANGFYICGAKRAGKTYAACAAIREWIVSEFVEDGRTSTEAMFVSMPRLISESFEDRSRLNKAMRVEFLVIDDLGAEASNEVVDEKVYTLLDAREKSAMPTIITSNIRAQDLPEQSPCYDARTLRRIVDMTGGGAQITDYQPEGGLFR